MNQYCPDCINPSGYGTIGHSGYPVYCEFHAVTAPTERFYDPTPPVTKHLDGVMG